MERREEPGKDGIVENTQTLLLLLLLKLNRWTARVILAGESGYAGLLHG